MYRWTSELLAQMEGQWDLFLTLFLAKKGDSCWNSTLSSSSQSLFSVDIIWEKTHYFSSCWCYLTLNAREILFWNRGDKRTSQKKYLNQGIFKYKICICCSFKYKYSSCSKKGMTKNTGCIDIWHTLYRIKCNTLYVSHKEERLLQEQAMGEGGLGLCKIFLRINRLHKARATGQGSEIPTKLRLTDSVPWHGSVSRKAVVLFCNCSTCE